jgi:hypothetical protein
LAASADRFVTLQGGMVVPVEPYLLLIDLEHRGFKFRLAEDGCPEVGPFDRLTDQDRALLRRWADHVAMLLRYTPDDSQGAVDLRTCVRCGVRYYVEDTIRDTTCYVCVRCTEAAHA